MTTYAITEERLKDFENNLPRYLIVGGCKCDTRSAIAEIRMCPLPATAAPDAPLRSIILGLPDPEKCKDCEAESCADACQRWIQHHDSALLAAARKDIIEEILRWREENRGKKVGYCTNGMIEDQYLYELIDVDSWTLKQHDARIRADAAKAVLDKVSEIVGSQTKVNSDGIRVLYVLHFEQDLQELRTSTGGNQE